MSIKHVCTGYCKKSLLWVSIIITFTCWTYFWHFPRWSYFEEHAMFLFFYTYLPWCQSFVMHGGYKLQIWHFFFTFTILRYMLPSLDWFYIFMMMILMFARHAGYIFIFTILPLFSWPEACWRLFNITYLSLSN